MENDKAELAKYIFMGWLDEFVRPRKTKSNIEFIEMKESPVLSRRRATSKTKVMIKMTILIVTVFLMNKLLKIQLLKLLAKKR